MTTNRVPVLCALIVIGAIAGVAASDVDGWSGTQREELRSLALSALEPLPPDATNRVADDARAAALALPGGVRGALRPDTRPFDGAGFSRPRG